MEIDDPSSPSLIRQAEACLPLTVPCMKHVARLGTGFRSSALLYKTDPWTANSALQEGKHVYAHYTCEVDGGTSNFVDGSTASSASASEHLSASLGLTAGNALLSANVTGSYDKSVQDMRKGSKASRNRVYRCGRIVRVAENSLTNAARSILTSECGEEAFKNNFGDYYVWGYSLGADAGACLALAATDNRETEKIAAKVTVKALFIGAISKSWAKSEEHGATELILEFSGYNTLTGMFSKLDSKAGVPMDSILAAVADYTHQVEHLQEQVDLKLREFGLDNHQALDLDNCNRLVASGLVTAVLLMPFRTMPDYVSAIHGGPREGARLSGLSQH